MVSVATRELGAGLDEENLVVALGTGTGEREGAGETRARMVGPAPTDRESAARGVPMIVGLKTLRPVLARRSASCPLCDAYIAANASWIVALPEALEPRSSRVRAVRSYRGRYAPLKWSHWYCAKEYFEDLGYRAVIPQTNLDRAEIKSEERGAW